MPLYTTATSTAGCQVSLSDYVALIRDYLEDWEYEDRLSTALTDSATTLIVPDGGKYAAGDLLQIDSEYISVTEAVGNALTVRRAWRNSMAAAHTTSATILRGSAWTDRMLENWVNESFAVMYPYLYVRQTTALTGSSTDYTYDLPADLTESSQIEMITATYGSDYSAPRMVHGTVRGEPPVLYVQGALSGWAMTLQYIKPFPTLPTSTSKTTLPEKAKLLPVYYACGQALEMKEAKRVRYSAYEGYQDERISQPGQQIQTGSYYWQKFNSLLRRVKMPARSFI